MTAPVREVHAGREHWQRAGRDVQARQGEKREQRRVKYKGTRGRESSHHILPPLGADVPAVPKVFGPGRASARGSSGLEERLS